MWWSRNLTPDLTNSIDCSLPLAALTSLCLRYSLNPGPGGHLASEGHCMLSFNSCNTCTIEFLIDIIVLWLFNEGFGIKHLRFWKLFFLLSSYMTLGKSFFFPGPCFPPLQNEDNNNFYLIRLLWGINCIIHINTLQYLTHQRYFINGQGDDKDDEMEEDGRWRI